MTDLPLDATAGSTSAPEDGYVIRPLVAADAADIPGAFRQVYGEEYISPVVYDPEAFAAANAQGRQVSIVARGPEGDLAGHLALAYCAPNRRIVEICQGIVVPAHRKSGIFASLMDQTLSFAREKLAVDGVFGTALTNHTVSQKMLAARGLRDLGLEIDYVPQRMLVSEGAGGPASTLVQACYFQPLDKAPCHLPPSYAAWFTQILEAAGLEGERYMHLSDRISLKESRIEIVDLARFDMSRVIVRRAGEDLPRLVAQVEERARSIGRKSLQVLVSLGEGDGAAAIEQLRLRGYAAGGLLPRYLEDGAHAAILFRHFGQPYFEGIRLHSQEAESLLDKVIADWQRATAEV